MSHPNAVEPQLELPEPDNPAAEISPENAAIARAAKEALYQSFPTMAQRKLELDLVKLAGLTSVIAALTSNDGMTTSVAALMAYTMYKIHANLTNIHCFHKGRATGHAEILLEAQPRAVVPVAPKQPDAIVWLVTTIVAKLRATAPEQGVPRAETVLVPAFDDLEPHGPAAAQPERAVVTEAAGPVQPRYSSWIDQKLAEGLLKTGEWIGGMGIWLGRLPLKLQQPEKPIASHKPTEDVHHDPLTNGHPAFSANGKGDVLKLIQQEERRRSLEA